MRRDKARMAGTTVTLLIAALFMATAPAGARSVRDNVTFSTAGRALFGADQGQAGATETIPFLNTPLFQFSAGPTSKEILLVVTVNVSPWVQFG